MTEKKSSRSVRKTLKEMINFLADLVYLLVEVTGNQLL